MLQRQTNAIALGFAAVIGAGAGVARLFGRTKSVGGIPRHPAGCAGPKLPPSGRIGNPTWERLWGGERSKGVGAFTYHPVLAPPGEST